MIATTRPAWATALLAVLVTAGALAMLLVHGHSPVAAAHVHGHATGANEHLAPGDADQAMVLDTAVASSVDESAGQASWASRDDDRLAFLGALVAVLAAVVGRTTRGRPLDRTASSPRRRFTWSTPVVRHEVVRV